MSQDTVTQSVTIAGMRYQQMFVKCGKARCPCGTDNASRHGPYWYAFWNAKDGQGRWRVRSKYLGKSLPVGIVQEKPS